MSETRYYPGGYMPAAPAQNMLEQWNDATLTYTSWDSNGNVTLTRPYTAAEQATAAQAQQQQQLSSNAATIQANVQANLTTITNWINANPTGATLTAGQTLVLAKM